MIYLDNAATSWPKPPEVLKAMADVLERAFGRGTTLTGQLPGALGRVYCPARLFSRFSDLCLERLEQGKQPICVEACPMYALDAGPLDKLKAKYGDMVEAEGFHYSERFKPSVIFKPKRRDSQQ